MKLEKHAYTKAFSENGAVDNTHKRGLRGLLKYFKLFGEIQGIQRHLSVRIDYPLGGFILD